MTTDAPQGSSPIQKVALWIATGFGFGYAPKAPGTVGSLWGVPLAWALMSIPNTFVQLGILVLLYAVGIPMCTSASKSLRKKDPAEVVWDEIATVPIVFLFVHPRLIDRPEILLLGFLLHRVFDISKLPPIKRIEKLPDGLGIMTDDVVAAVYGCVSMHCLLNLIPWLAR